MALVLNYSASTNGVTTVGSGNATLPDFKCPKDYSVAFTPTGGVGVGPYTTVYSPVLSPVVPTTLPPYFLYVSTMTWLGGLTDNGVWQFQVTVTDTITLEEFTAIYTLNVNLLNTDTSNLQTEICGGVPYTGTVEATGGQYPYTFGATFLPSGLTITTTNPGALGQPGVGTISGTPVTPGIFNTTIKVWDSNPANTCQINIPVTFYVAIPEITTSTLPDICQNSAYSQTLTATGILSGGATWSVSSGSLPPGLTINPSTGAITGTATTAGSYTFTITITDNLTGCSKDKNFSIVVNAQPSITTAGIPTICSASSYNLQFTGTNTDGNTLWTVVGGSLPLNVTLSTAGLLAGQPFSFGNYSVTIRALNQTGCSTTRVYNFTVNQTPVNNTAVLPDGCQHRLYNTSIAAAGGSGSYTWGLVAGALPAGIVLNPLTGVLSGVTANPGLYSPTIRITDDISGCSVDQAYSFTIYPNAQVTTTTLPDAVVNAAYSQILATDGGGAAPYTWSIEPGYALPTGLSINASTGEISGTPTIVGSTTFVVRLQSTNNCYTTKSLTINVVNVTPTITPTNPPNSCQNILYPETTLQVLGGTPPYSWSLIGGSLPTGVTLSAAGVLSGTPTNFGTFNPQIEVTDALSNTDNNTFTFDIYEEPLVAPPITPGCKDNTYSYTIVPSTGTAPFTFTISSLPTGLTLDPNTGVISGTPTVAGTTIVAVSATDANGCTGTSEPIPFVIYSSPVISTTTLPAGNENQPYSVTLVGTGGVSPYTWLQTAGALPTGLTFNPATATISGTPDPSTTGTYPITIRITSTATGCYSERSYSLFINNALLPIITPVAIPDTCANIAYAPITFAATSGVAPYSWSVVGVIPPGTTFNTSTGEFSGTPTTAGTYYFSIVVTDAQNLTDSDDYAVSIFENPTITTTTLLPWQATIPGYSQFLQATGGSTPYSWAVTVGSLPTGLNLNAGTGEISGTPTTQNVYNFTVEVTTNDGCTDTQDLTIEILAAPPPPPVFDTTSLPNICQNVFYDETINVTATNPPVTYSVISGSLPTGLTLDPDTGQLSGTPTLFGTFSFTVKVIDRVNAFANQVFTITIYPKVSMGFTSDPQTLPLGIYTKYYGYPIPTGTGTGPFTWTVTGTLPDGILFDPISGGLAGTPTEYGSFGLNIQVEDYRGCQDSNNVVLVIVGPPIIVTKLLPSGVLGVDYDQTVFAEGGTPAYSWAKVNGGLPPGLGLNPVTGQIVGKPTKLGLFKFTLQVIDQNGLTDEQDLAILITTPEDSDVTRARLVSEMSDPVIVVDPFHSIEMVNFLPGIFKEKKNGL